VIRNATLEDVPGCVAMGARFVRCNGISDVIPFDAESAAVTLCALVGDPRGCLLVAEVDGALVGMAAGRVYPHYWNARHLTGQEIFWWVEPAHRCGLGLKMLGALEQWAHSLGCQSWRMIALEAQRPDAVGALYRRRGYRRTEQVYLKGLEHG
jgi:GNAT superfamily N-acetyltransferase